MTSEFSCNSYRSRLGFYEVFDTRVGMIALSSESGVAHKVYTALVLPP